MRQMRLAMLESHAASTAVIEAQKEARKKLNHDLVKAKKVLKNLDELRCVEHVGASVVRAGKQELWLY